MASFAPQGHEGTPLWPIRADDLVSNRRRITDIHWWGSYIGWETNHPGPLTRRHIRSIRTTTFLDSG